MRVGCRCTGDASRHGSMLYRERCTQPSDRIVAVALAYVLCSCVIYVVGIVSCKFRPLLSGRCSTVLQQHSSFSTTTNELRTSPSTLQPCHLSFEKSKVCQRLVLRKTSLLRRSTNKGTPPSLSSPFFLRRLRYTRAEDYLYRRTGA